MGGQHRRPRGRRGQAAAGAAEADHAWERAVPGRPGEQPPHPRLTGVAAAPRVSQCRSRTASAIRPAVAAWTRAVSGADGGRRDGPTGWPDHSPNGSTPV
ncbi:MAG: hypothetical protein ACJ782_04160 [Actinomycetota bacterium]